MGDRGTADAAAGGTPASGARGAGRWALLALAATATLTVTLAAAAAEGAARTRAAAGGPERFVGTTVTELVDEDGVALATVRLGTAIRGDADGAPVSVAGWSWTAGPATLFLGTTQRIVLASLTDEGRAARVVLDEVTDAYGIAWQQVRLDGFLNADDLVDDLDDVWAAADGLKAERCGVCHAVPAADRLPVYRWPDRLRTCGRGRAGLDADQLELITKYVQYHTSSP